MTEAVPASADRKRLFVPVVAVESEIAPQFVLSVLEASETPAGVVDVAGCHVFIEALSAAALDEAGVQARFRQADAVVLLLRFLDNATLDKTARWLPRLTLPSAPLGVFIYCADPANRQFKISCDACGQKLWVLEKEIGLRGRCANCRGPMRIPSPAERARKRLNIPDSVPVLNVARGDAPLCRGALANLLARVAFVNPAQPGMTSLEFLKRATVPIQIQSK